MLHKNELDKRQELTDTEKLVLGTLIMSQGAFEYMSTQGLKFEMFSDSEARNIAEQIATYRINNTVDMVSITEIKTSLSKLELSQLIEFERYESVNMYESYFKQLYSDFIKAQVRSLAQTVEYTPQGILHLADELMILVGTEKQKDLLVIAREVMDDIRARQHPDYINEYKTGLYDYDKLGHFERGDLMILGGKSGHGKSRMALNLTYRWLKSGLRVVYISYEMTIRACLLSLSLIKEKLSWDAARVQKDKMLTPEQTAGLELGMEWLAAQPLIINEFATTLPQVNLLVRQHKADVFVIDTVNELISSDAQFWVKLHALASGYKKIAKQHDCLCIMIAQLGTFEGRPTQKEMLSGSKDMKNPADYMDFIYREAEAHPYECPVELQRVMEIFRVKGRFTGTGRCLLKFYPTTGHADYFDEMEKKVIMEAIKHLTKKK